MNWGAAVLILAGIGIVAVGVSGSQNTVCQAMSGSNCSWLPTPSSGTPPGTTTSGGITYTSGEPASAQSIDTIINNCKGTSTCQSYMTLAASDASQAGVDSTDFVRQIAQESAFNPNAKSSAGAIGIAQFMPSTASTLGINPSNPTQSLQAAANLMGGYETYWTDVLNKSQYGFSGGSAEAEALALSSYNYGLGGTQGLAKKYGAAWLNNAPSQTQNYIQAIEYPKTPVPVVG